MITRIHKLNEKNKALFDNIKELKEHLTQCIERTEILQHKINLNESEIALFKEMTDEEFNKTEYRKEEFRPI